MFQMLSFVLKVLAAVGGGILGWYVTPPLVRLLVRVAVHKPAPNFLVTVSRLMGALVVAAIVWAIWSFGFGDGWGFGTGPGGGPGLGAGSGGKQVAKDSEPKDATVKEKDGKEKDGKKDGPSLPENLTVRMRGGSGVGEQFYLVNDKAMTLEQVREVLQKERGHLKAVEIVIDENSVSDAHPAVARLRRLAHDQGLAVQTQIDEKAGGR